MKVPKNMRQQCPTCGYEKCVPKSVAENGRYPSGVILRCKQCKTISVLNEQMDWVFFQKWDV